MNRIKEAFLVILLCFSLLLCGCGQEPPIVDEPTEEKLFESTMRGPDYWYSNGGYFPYVITAEIPTTRKISVEFLSQIKIGLMTIDSTDYSFCRIIEAEGFEISTPFDNSVKDSTADVYYDVRNEPYYVDAKSVDETTRASYTEMITLKMYDMTPRSGCVVIHLQDSYDDEQYFVFKGIDYATDGEYIAFSLESPEAAQAMLEK